ncbi:hypothetical protein [Skermania piniformis]|uniref:Uncharacterized protein n=1 Tax=Skermania pinensis TaxID=39122 RepID=A0ABX8SJL7_9ACTN|nr:hypothetical protein [Skermania piniformis]QXQ15886.1 hypothetical protein KV203_12250 [Skermania piniformis]
MRRQEPGVTQPRPPTVAEARARDKARRHAAEAQQAEEAAAARRRTRNRRLMGGAAVVGVVALVAVGYRALSSSNDDVTAHCIIDENGVQQVVDDDYCARGTPGVGGIFILGGHQYRYYYGGTGTVGQAPRGGTTVLPKGATVTTKSGSTIQRGGLGSKSGGSSSGS